MDINFSIFLVSYICLKIPLEINLYSTPTRRENLVYNNYEFKKKKTLADFLIHKTCIANSTGFFCVWLFQI